MHLEIGNLNTRAVTATEDESRFLREILAFKDEAAQWKRGGGRYAKTDDKIRLFNLMNSSFPTGYLSIVVRMAREAGYPVAWTDTRKTPDAVRLAEQTGFVPDLAWLRDYQLEAVKAALRRKRGIIWAPTGSGKTEIMIGIVKALPCRWVVLVHRGTLMDQAAERYEKRTGKKAGRIAGGIWDVQDFTVATFQTLAKNAGKPEAQRLFAETEGLQVDEAHTLPAGSFYTVATRFHQAHYRFGLSATPLARGDQKSIFTVAATGPVIYRIQAETLVQAGVIARPEITFHPVAQTVEKPTWQGVYGDGVVRSAYRNRNIAEAAKRAAKPCLVFVKEIKHGKALSDLLIDAGLEVEFVWGTDSIEERKAAITRLERGDTEVLIASTVFQEGVDMPSIASVVVGSGGRSVIAALQRIGRGMRIHKETGKTTFQVWDFADRGNKWLERHSKQRMAAYSGEGFAVAVKDSPLVAPSKQMLNAEVKLKGARARADEARAAAAELAIKKVG